MTRLTLPSRDRGENGDGGFTMVEILVALLIFSVLTAIMATMLITTMSNTADLNQRMNAGGQQQNAIEWSSRVVRYTAPPNAGEPAISAATGTSFTFYTYSGTTSEDIGAPVRARLWLDPERGFISDIADPVMNGSVPTYPNPPTSRVLINADDIDLTRTVFTYYDANGTVLPTGTSGMSVANRALVRSVRIEFRDDDTSQRVEQTIRLVNLT